MLVIIDGNCSFCLWASRWLRRICKPGLDILTLDLVSIDVINQWEANPLWSVDSIKVISQGQLWIKSAAVAQVMREAHWFAQPLRLLFVVPQRLLDVLYDWVARHRKSDTCELPQKS